MNHPVKLILALLVLTAWCAGDWFIALPEGARATYVGRDTCARCHETQLHQWTGSHHDRAMEVATESSVLGDFSDVEFDHFGLTTRFFRRDGKFFAHTEGPDGEYRDYEIKYTFGIEPLQQYMVEFPDGRVQVLRVSWDTERRRWFYVEPPDVIGERIEAGDPMHWTGMSQNWNTMCAECHSTNLQKNFDLASNSYDTAYSEINVSCETCHGPGSMHVELAESHTLFWDRHHGYGLAKLKGGSADREIETCAPCHSRRSPVRPEYHAGERFLNHYQPSLIRQGLYHADGQILDEVYVYGSFLQSKMYQEGIRCTDCHNPHTLELKYQGNRLCAQCHQPGKYDTPNHHHHTDLAATQCVSCHMPSRNYMVVDGRRDHSLRIPRPDLSIELGTPNACNDCHQEPNETASWAADAVRDWYGEKRPDDPHYAVALAAGQKGEPEGLGLLRSLLRRRETPDIVRATAVELLGGYDPKKIETLCREALTHASPLVRAAAVQTVPMLDSSGPTSVERVKQDVASRLSDPVQIVRSAAARRLISDAARLKDSEVREALDRAIEQYREGELMMQDRAGAHINLSMLSRALGDVDAAIESLRTAIRLEPYLTGPRGELAIVLQDNNGDPEEIDRLRQEEIELLLRDSGLMPNVSFPHYRRGMLLYQLGQVDEAHAALAEACRLEPNSYDNWLALALICERLGKQDEAIEALGRMYKLRPDDPAIRGIFQRLQNPKDAQQE